MSRLIDADELIANNVEAVSKHKLYENGMTLAWGEEVVSVKNIKRAPTVNQWIPCSERLPDKDGDYLVTIKYRVMNKPICTTSSYANNLYEVDDFDFEDKKGKSGWYYDDSEYGYGEVTNVIAWMPLPHPYDQQKSEEV